MLAYTRTKSLAKERMIRPKMCTCRVRKVRTCRMLILAFFSKLWRATVSSPWNCWPLNLVKLLRHIRTACILNIRTIRFKIGRFHQLWRPVIFSFCLFIIQVLILIYFTHFFHVSFNSSSLVHEWILLHKDRILVQYLTYLLFCISHTSINLNNCQDKITESRYGSINRVNVFVRCFIFGDKRRVNLRVRFALNFNTIGSPESWVE